MTNGPSGHDGPHVFVDDLEAPAISDADRHHLARVLRLRTGDRLTVSDGAGRWRLCVFGDQLDPSGEIIEVPPAHPAVTVAFAALKGGRAEMIVQKLTELGVDEIIPVLTERSVVRWADDQVVKAHERQQRVAREAAMQCRRVRLPAVAPLMGLAEVADRAGAVLADRRGEPPSLDRPTIVVGPEGGFTESELRGRPHVALGPLVLRAETAAMTAGGLLTALRARLVRSAQPESADHAAR